MEIEMFVANACVRLWVCFAHVHAQYWSIQNLEPDAELTALWARWACHSLSFILWTSCTSPQNCEQINQLETTEDYDKTSFKSHQCFSLSSSFYFPDPKIGAKVGYCWTRRDVPFSEIRSFSCLLSVLSLRTADKGHYSNMAWHRMQSLSFQAGYKLVQLINFIERWCNYFFFFACKGRKKFIFFGFDWKLNDPHYSISQTTM